MLDAGGHLHFHSPVQISLHVAYIARDVKIVIKHAKNFISIYLTRSVASVPYYITDFPPIGCRMKFEGLRVDKYVGVYYIYLKKKVTQS